MDIIFPRYNCQGSINMIIASIQRQVNILSYSRGDKYIITMYNICCMFRIAYDALQFEDIDTYISDLQGIQSLPRFIHIILQIANIQLWKKTWIFGISLFNITVFSEHKNKVSVISHHKDFYFLVLLLLYIFSGDLIICSL